MRLMSKLLITSATFVLGLLVAGAHGDTLPLPQNLSGFSTHDGEVYFGESDAREVHIGDPLQSHGGCQSGATIKASSLSSDSEVP